MLKKLLALAAMLYAAASFAAVDVNTATAAELEGVKGIGQATSAHILEERKHGAFKDWDDFKNRVKGIGDKSAAKLSAEGLTVGGAAYKGAAPAKGGAKAAAKADAKAAKPDAKADPKADAPAKGKAAK